MPISAKFNDLTASQKEAVSHFEGPLLVIAGPGSGKTRVIINRIAALIAQGVSPWNICAITFTNKAAEEMRNRVVAMNTPAGTHVSTFHSLCVRVLRYHGSHVGVGSNFSIYDDSEQTKCMKEALKTLNLDTTNFTPGKLLEAISLLKNKLEYPDAFAARASDYFSKIVAKAYKAYQHLLTQNNAVDFDDLLMKTAVLLRDFPAVREELSNRYKFLLVDEYQDTNHAQYAIARCIALGHGNICVTGDPDQSIYRWRGADIANILAFEKDWPSAKVVKLEENFRSAPNILALADKLIAANTSRKAKRLIPVIPHPGEVIIRQYEDEAYEADSIISDIARLAKNGVPYSDIAVFYRVNSMSRPIEEALVRSRLPYQVVRGVEFYGRKEIKDMLAYCKLIVNPPDDVALTRIINSPTRGIGDTTLEKVAAHARMHNLPLYEALKQTFAVTSLSQAVRTKIAAFVAMIEQFKPLAAGPVAPLMKKVFEDSGMQKSLEAGGLEGSAALDNVEELINAAAIYDQQIDNPALYDYLQQIALFSDTDKFDPASGKIALMSLHAAKGLEFKHVYIIGLQQGILPHERSKDNPDELEEERRLLFVGITRAKKGLHIAYTRHRTIRGLLMRSIPSQFLYELGASDLPSRDSFLAESSRDFNDFRDDYIADLPSRTMQTPAPSSASKKAPFTTDELVEHKVFGLGRIKSYTDMGENSIVAVRFNSGQTKTLMVKYANLKKV